MARNPITSKGWIPEEFDSSVINAISASSVIEARAHKVPMNTDTKNIPRGGTVDVGIVAKGNAYAEDVHSYDMVTLSAVKFGTAVRLAEEDLADSPLNIINQKKAEWGSSYARFIDNACLGTTAAIGSGVPFTSVYRALSQANAATGYVANANIIKTTAGAAVTLQNLSDALGKREGTDYFDPSKELIIAHPSFRQTLRDLKDGDGRPLYAVNLAAGQPDTLFGLPIVFTNGARTSATATANPTGNPLVIFANTDLLNLGVRSGPESVVIDGRDGTSALTDETLIKMRARRGFVIGHENAFAIVEKVAA